MRPAWTSQRCAGAAGRRSAPCVRNSSLLWGSVRLLRAGASGRAGQAQCKHSTGCKLHGARHLTSQDVELSRKAQRRSRSSRTQAPRSSSGGKCRDHCREVRGRALSTYRWNHVPGAVSRGLAASFCGATDLTEAAVWPEQSVGAGACCSSQVFVSCHKNL